MCSKEWLFYLFLYLSENRSITPETAVVVNVKNWSQMDIRYFNPFIILFSLYIFKKCISLLSSQNIGQHLALLRVKYMKYKFFCWFNFLETRFMKVLILVLSASQGRSGGLRGSPPLAHFKQAFFYFPKWQTKH